LPFATDQDPGQKAMVRRVIRELATVPGRGAAVEAIFTSTDRRARQPDAENITLYNFIGAGPSPFTPRPSIVRFERSFAAPFACSVSLAVTAPFHHSWSSVDAAADFRHWAVDSAQGSEVEWGPVPLRDPGAEVAGRELWLAIKRSHTTVRPIGRVVPATGPFAVRVTLRTAAPLDPVAVIKACVDGPIAALQCFEDRHTAAAVLGRLAAKGYWRGLASMPELTELSLEGPALFAAGPFNGNGLNPADGRCVAGEIRVEIDPAATTPRLTGQVVRVVAR
jgi:hypothetical protein